MNNTMKGIVIAILFSNLLLSFEWIFAWLAYFVFLSFWLPGGSKRVYYSSNVILNFFMFMKTGFGSIFTKKLRCLFRDSLFNHIYFSPVSIHKIRRLIVKIQPTLMNHKLADQMKLINNWLLNTTRYN